MRREIAVRLLGGTLRLARSASGVARRGSCAPEVDRITTGAAMGFSTAVGPTSRAPVRWLPAGASAAMRTFQARPYAAAAAPPTPPTHPRRTPSCRMSSSAAPRPRTSSPSRTSSAKIPTASPPPGPPSSGRWVRPAIPDPSRATLTNESHGENVPRLRARRDPPSPHPQKSNIAGGASLKRAEVKNGTRRLD